MVLNDCQFFVHNSIHVFDTSHNAHNNLYLQYNLLSRIILFDAIVWRFCGKYHVFSTSNTRIHSMLMIKGVTLIRECDSAGKGKLIQNNNS